MSEIPQRIEREMYEIRSRMAPDVRDLGQHVQPKVIGQQVTTRLKERIKNTLTHTGKGLLDSARRQVESLGEARRNRNPSPFTEAVRSDPRPFILLAVILAVTLLAVRRLGSNGRG